MTCEFIFFALLVGNAREKVTLKDDFRDALDQVISYVSGRSAVIVANVIKKKVVKDVQLSTLGFVTTKALPEHMNFSLFEALTIDKTPRGVRFQESICLCFFNIAVLAGLSCRTDTELVEVIWDVRTWIHNFFLLMFSYIYKLLLQVASISEFGIGLHPIVTPIRRPLLDNPGLYIHIFLITFNSTFNFFFKFQGDEMVTKSWNRPTYQCISIVCKIQMETPLCTWWVQGKHMSYKKENVIADYYLFYRPVLWCSFIFNFHNDRIEILCSKPR